MLKKIISKCISFINPFETLMGATAPLSRKMSTGTKGPRFTDEVTCAIGNLPWDLADLVDRYL